jgi:hypothetical protein
MNVIARVAFLMDDLTVTGRLLMERYDETTREPITD